MGGGGGGGGIGRGRGGGVGARVTGEPVSAQTVSTLTKSLDRVVKRFHEAPLRDEWAYLFLDGVSLRVRRPAGPEAGADAGGLRGADGWATALAGLCAEPRGEPGRLGRSAAGPPSAGLARLTLPAHRDRRLPRFGGSNSDGVPARSAPAVLGAQDAEHSGKSPEAGLRRGEDRCPGHLSGLARRPRPAGLPALRGPLARELSGDGAAVGARLAGAAVVLPVPATSVAKAAHHPRHRALFRGGSSPHSTDGLLCQPPECGSHRILDL